MHASTVLVLFLQKKQQSVEHICQNLKELNSAIVKRIDPEGKFSYTENDDFKSFLNNLKENHSIMKKEEKANLIKILPKTWSSGQLAKETGIPLNLICEARNNSLKIIRKQRND